NVLSPGLVETPNTAPMLADPPERLRRVVLDRIPLGRHGQAEDVVNAAVFLCSDEASWISGAHLVVDGGGSGLGWPADLRWGCGELAVGARRTPVEWAMVGRRIGDGGASNRRWWRLESAMVVRRIGSAGGRVR